jgi:hypothetical protein
MRYRTFGFSRYDTISKDDLRLAVGVKVGAAENSWNISGTFGNQEKEGAEGCLVSG